MDNSQRAHAFYIIDGYNLLFRVTWAKQDKLEAQRARLIEEIDQYARALNLQICIVFDAPFQSGELSRGHFRSLEIIFTAERETADQYIISLIDKLVLTKQKIVVVTSDRKLAKEVKQPNINVELVEEFIHWVRKRFMRKMIKTCAKKPRELTQNKRVVNPSAIKKGTSLALHSSPQPPEQKEPKLLTIEEQYLQEFTKRFEETKWAKNPTTSQQPQHTQHPSGCSLKKKKPSKKPSKPYSTHDLESIFQERYNRLYELDE